jgi:exodeoxyribonuclease-5
MITTTIQLTTEQQSAVDSAVETINKGGQLYRIGGYAGTGKTTVAKSIVEQLENPCCCAFTGKAAYRLREKGLDGTMTIHRAIYDYDPGSKKFHLKPYIEESYFLIDEGSMISLDLWRDLQSFGRPVIMLGDPGQLEPVGSDPRLMHEPDVVLNQIHRQAADSGIIQFATNIRLRTHRPDMTYRDVEVVRGAKPCQNDLEHADIVLCGYNRTRIRYNTAIRKMRGFDGLLQQGEKIIILRNNIELGVFNGQILTVDDVEPEGTISVTAHCVTDDGERLALPLLKKQFNNMKLEQGDFRSIALADYGYCITVHKSQGSEWDSVLVIDEQCEYWNATRWRYTAITRAAKELKYFVK